MQKHRSGIDEALATTKGQLNKLHSDISNTLEKIGSREKYLNSQLEPLLVQYRALQVSIVSCIVLKIEMHCKAVYINWSYKLFVLVFLLIIYHIKIVSKKSCIP
jgi:hypothetical protein